MKLPPSSKRRGAALVIVLAFIVLLTGMVVAFFARAMSERQISNSSANQTRVDILADGASDQIIADLKQEITASSAATVIATGTVNTYLYLAGTNTTFVPYRVGTNNNLPNLVKRSAAGQSFFSGAAYANSTNFPASNRAAVVSGTVGVSSTTQTINYRYVSPERWNKSLLLPVTSGTSFDPTPAGFVAPDWVLVARSGTNPTTWSPNLITSGTDPNSVVGRYAYTIYDEGGLLDVNAAGYPMQGGTGAYTNPLPLLTGSQTGYKNSLAFADLTQIPGINSLTTAQQQKLTYNLVGWRNSATAQPTGSFPNLSFSTGANYYNYLLANTTGFLTVSGTALNNGQSDRMFSSRQELIKFLQSGLSISGTNLSALNYLTTFTRDINQPSYVAAVQTNPSSPPPVVLAASQGGNSAVGGDKLINPSFPGTRVQASFTRLDGSTANIGDPLVNKRFALNRLAWVTPYGAISNGAVYNPAVPAAVITALKNNGLTDSYLLLGTAQNIQNYFGLTWDGSRWVYDIHRGTSGTARIIKLVGRPSSVPTADSAKYVQDSNREPDFFELLKAGISVGSLGKAATTSNADITSGQQPSAYGVAQVPLNMRYAFDSSVDYHIIQIGANILSEINPTSYPIRIAFDDGSGRGSGLPTGPAWEFQGVTDLPYLQYVFNGGLRIQAPNPAPTGGAADNSPFQYPVSVNKPLITPGNAYMIQVPAVWNPYDPNGTPGVLRPSQFRIVIDNNDPLSPSGSSNPSLNVWHGAVADAATTGPSGPNSGMLPPHPVYSWTVSGLGKTTEYPTQPPNYPSPGRGTPIFDAVKFDDGNGALFREPTVIFKAQSATTGNATRVNALLNATPGNVSPAPGNITSLDANPLPGESDGSTGPWAPLVLGQFPLAFSKDNTNTTTYYTGTGLIGLATGNGDNRVYFTYRLQYQDASGNWITYDTKYGRTTHGLCVFQSDVTPGTFSPCVIRGSDRGDFSTYSWASAIDPRTARFGLFMDAINIHHNQAWVGADPQGWIYNSSGAATVATDGIIYPIRPDNNTGYFFGNVDSKNLPPGGKVNGTDITDYGGTKDVPYPGYPVTTTTSGWPAPVFEFTNDVWMFAPGMYAQNNPGAPFYFHNGGLLITQPSYYADADGVVRRGASAYVPADNSNKTSATTPVGLPTASINGYSGKPASLVTPASATPFTQSQSRPLLLHRPFRTVAELGYVFRDLPWKNLDFFTPESGDAALLDLFCINDSGDSNGMVAGKVNLNTRQAPVLSAIVGGAYVDDPKVTNATVGWVSPTLSSTISSLVVARTTGTNYGPLQNVSELIGKWNSGVAVSGTYYGISTYFPTNPGNNWGIDLPSTYKDGQRSYTGFSGPDLTAISSGTSGTLSDAFTALSNPLQTSMAQTQRFREAPIRALTAAGQTRVWNLMIDVVAQTGRYPQGSPGFTKTVGGSTVDSFNVEGEQRYWVHVAIDRITGKVIDKQVEVVKE